MIEQHFFVQDTAQPEEWEKFRAVLCNIKPYGIDERANAYILFFESGAIQRNDALVVESIYYLMDNKKLRFVAPPVAGRNVYFDIPLKEIVDVYEVNVAKQSSAQKAEYRILCRLEHETTYTVDFYLPQQLIDMAMVYFNSYPFAKSYLLRKVL